MSPSPRKESPPVDDSSDNSPDDSSPDDSPSPPTNSKSSPSPPPSSPPPKSPPPSDKSSPPPSPDKSSPPPNSDKSSPPPNSDKSSPPPPDKSSPPPHSDKNSPPPGDDNSSPPNNSKSPSHDSDNNNSSNNNNNNNNNNNGGNNNNNSGNNNSNNNSGNNNNKNDQNSNSNNNNNNNNSNKKNQPPPKSGSSYLSPPYQPPSSQARSASLPAIADNSDPPPSGPSRTIIVGAAAGAGFLVVVMIVCIVACARKKKRRPHDQMHYYRDNSHGGGYFNTVPQKNQTTSAGPEHIVQLPPRTSSAQVSSEYNWPIAPPPPPPMMNSSDMSSAGFSGPYQAAPPPPPAMALGFNQSSFTYNDLAAATNNFAQANLLGQGGFGYVHKGVLPNGKEIAVKSLKASSGQGEREFQAEVDIISRVHHRHLVSLVGYCIAGSQRMLVYEFVPNGTLEYHLHGDNRPTMDWATRLKIALGAAKGFAYLHEDCHPRIIHRDIKTANILIEHNFEAKVADFGLAKLSTENHTHVSTRIMGTFGYLAPEYASSGKLTEKSDVYSYGIMLLELITGRRPIDIESDDDSLVDWARPILVRVTEGESYEELVDPRLENNYDPQEMLRMVGSAGACVRQAAKKRPKMSQIVRCLEGDVSLDVLNEGVRSVHTAMFGSGSSEDDGSSVDMKRFRKGGATSSQEYSSSELGTGEFAHNNNKH